MIAQVARLSLDHERLHAERTAQLRELRASRVRIVAAPTANVEAWNVTCTTAPNSGSSRSHSAFSSQSSPLPPLEFPAQQSARRRRNRSGYSSGRAARHRTRALPARTGRRGPGVRPRDICRGPIPHQSSWIVTCRIDCLRLSRRQPTSQPLTSWRRRPTNPQQGERSALGRRATGCTSNSPGAGVRNDLTMAEDRVGALGGTVQRIGAGLIRIVLPCES